MNDVVRMTDPARELAELCESLKEGISPENIRGEDYLSQRFHVDLWSPEFFEIIFTISQRIREVDLALNLISLDDDFKDDIRDHIKQISHAFSAQSLRGQWNHVASTCLSRENIQPLKGISGQIRHVMSYRHLSGDDASAVISDVSALIDWLVEHQISENDFIRQALIDGLQRFVFRLTHLKWIGWGYALESLRDVISAYTMLERSGINPVDNPDAEAILKRTAKVIKLISDKIDVAKNVSEKADFLIKAYGVASLIYTGTPVVAALIGKG